MMPEHAARLASVTPELAAAFLEISQKFALAFPGSHLNIAQGYRTPAGQQAAAAAGKSKADGLTRFSKHQSYPAQALDFAVIGDDARYITDGEDDRYRWVGERFEEAGFGWGGRWTHPDWDHVDLLGPAPTDSKAGHMAYLRAIEAAPFLRVV